MELTELLVPVTERPDPTKCPECGRDIDWRDLDYRQGYCAPCHLAITQGE